MPLPGGVVYKIRKNDGTTLFGEYFSIRKKVITFYMYHSYKYERIKKSDIKFIESGMCISTIGSPYDNYWF